MVEELNALPLAVGGGLADMKYARPLVKEQAQIQRARVEDQPGVAAQVLMGKGAYLLVNGVVVAADAFGFAHRFQRGGSRGRHRAGAASWPTGEGQLGFADVH